MDEIHKTAEMVDPNPANNAKYEKLLPVFDMATGYLAKVSDALNEVEL